MPEAIIRCYAELNDFLPSSRRQRPFRHVFDGRVSIKDMLESLGIPHTEIDLMLANGLLVDFSYLVADGDRIAVYPAFHALVAPATPGVRPPALDEPRFVLDAHLGRLAAYLRLLGFDTLYDNGFNDESLARISRTEQRILLTRDRGLLKRSEVQHGYCVRSTVSREQLVEVLHRYELGGRLRPGTRCVHCNGLLREVPKEAIEDRLPPRTRTYYDRFWVCEGCGQVYWEGSHYPAMRRLIEFVQGALAPPSPG